MFIALPLTYVLTAVYYPSFLSDFFTQYSDKFRFLKGSDFLKDRCGRDSVATLKSASKTDGNLYLRLSDDDDFYLRIKMLIEKDLKVGIVSNHKKEIEKINALLLKDFPNKDLN